MHLGVIVETGSMRLTLSQVSPHGRLIWSNAIFRYYINNGNHATPVNILRRLIFTQLFNKTFTLS